MSAARLLEASSLAVSWRQTSVALHDVSLHVDAGEIVALLGGNGAGKTTTLKAISRLLHAERGELTAGAITFDGVNVARDEPWRLVERGLAQVLEGRRCFAHLSVEENLRLGGFVRRGRHAVLAADLERVYTLFPRLKLRRRLPAGYTSGGEQQMLAIGRALMARPKLVLLDEPSMGLAPQIVDEIFEIVAALNRDGVSFLLAEQNAAVALRHADRGYVLESGTVAAHGRAAQLRDLDTLRDAYLGRAGQRDEARVS